MRRVVWSVLTGLGAFFIVLAILSKLYVPGQAVKFPLNEYGISSLVAKNAEWFSPKSVSELQGVTLEATSTVKGDVSQADALGSSKVAVWQSYSVLEDTTDHQPVSIPALADVFAFDRKTGAIVKWSGNSVDGKPVNPSGQGYVWPLGAKKQSYQVYDTTLLRPVTFKFKTTATSDGIPTYEYVANIPSTQVGTQSLPGSIVGLKAATVTLPEFYSAQEEYFVDPVTGAPISVVRSTHSVLQDSTGTTRLVLLDGTFKSTAGSIAAEVKTDMKYRNEIILTTSIIPIVAGVLGIILLVIGLVLSRTKPEDEEYEDEDEPVSSTV
jgi:Porin PorA